jgi:uncharacterized protein (TIGR02284 family)
MDDHLKSTLESLVQANTDCWNGLATAMKHVNDTDCLILLRHLAQKQSAQTCQLQDALVMERDYPQMKGTLSGKARQMWIAVEGTITGQDDLAILPEVRKIEERLRQEYEAAQPAAENSSVGELITTHLDNINSACERISEMYDLMKRRAAESI